MLVEALLLAATIILLILWLYVEAPNYTLKKKLETIPGPKPLPILGNTLGITRQKSILGYLTKCAKEYGPVYKLHFPGHIVVNLTSPDDIEILLKSNELLDKSKITKEFIGPWLGDGLALSSGDKWKEHRKLITPAFHFNILEKFFEVFREQTNVLIEILKTKTNQNIDIFEFLQLFALDVICETAMGTKIHAQTKLEGNDYVRAAKQVLKCISDRLTSPILSIPFVYSLSPTGRKEAEAVKVLKSTTDRVIQTRREQLINQSKTIDNENNVSDLGEKKRVAFLDLLLQARHTDGRPLTNQEISDEVQTFMFARHDTTSTQMSFLLYLLTTEPEIQEKLYQEQCEILGEDKCEPTFQDIQNMNYLERAIKESQRLWGSVLSYGRQISKDLQLKTNGYVIPKGTQVDIFAHYLHRNPKVWPDPEKFDPDRFLPENVRKRSVFAFVPFSAGPRNCIGQRFAMLEMKTCLSSIIRNFQILPAIDSNGKKIEPQIELVLLLTSLNGVQIRLSPRKK